MAIAVRNQTSKINSAINVTPMVDVMLVLLIIFMVITPMLHPGPDVQLPRAQNPAEMRDADREDSLVVAINKEGSVFLGNERIDLTELAQKVRDRIVGHPGQVAFVRADGRARYRMVADVVDTVRSAGVSELGLLTERQRQ